MTLMLKAGQEKGGAQNDLNIKGWWTDREQETEGGSDRDREKERDRKRVRKKKKREKKERADSDSRKKGKEDGGLQDDLNIKRVIIQVQSFIIKCLSFRRVSFVQGYRLHIEKLCT